MLAGIWSHRETIDGVTFTFADLLDAHEILDVRERNEAEYRAWRKAQEDA
jgi:hypothetical protein